MLRKVNVTNALPLSGIILNTSGACMYTYVKYNEGQRNKRLEGGKRPLLPTTTATTESNNNNTAGKSVAALPAIASGFITSEEMARARDNRVARSDLGDMSDRGPTFSIDIDAKR